MSLIRFAVETDLPQLADLYRESIEHQCLYSEDYRTGPDIEWGTHVAHMLKRKDTGVFVAERHGDLVGFMRARIVLQAPVTPMGRIKGKVQALLRWNAGPQGSIYSSRRYGFIQDIYLAPCARRTAAGVGFKLFEECLKWLKENDIDVVEAGVAAGNEDIVNLSSKLGFETIGLVLQRKVRIPEEGARVPN